MDAAMTLLAKYTALVRECEGTSFIDRLRKPGYRGYGYAHGFSDEDIEKLVEAEEIGTKVLGRGQIGRANPPPNHNHA